MMYCGVALLMTLVCMGAKPRVVTLFLAGDSTCADKTELDASPERGWGQVFPTYLNGKKIRVENHAKNGRSTKSFIDEGRWDDLLAHVQSGDIVIIQFGHNDEKSADSTRYSDINQYKANLRKMVLDVQLHKATPILATSIVRRNFVDGVLHETHGAYPDAVRELAKEMQVQLLDMHALSKEQVTEWGDEESKKYYMHVAPGTWSKFPDGKIDDTHLNEAGALAMADLVVKAVKTGNVQPLCKYVHERKAADKPIYTVLCISR